MTPEEVRTTEDARAIVEERNLSHVKVGLFDIDGILRGKYMSRDKFLASLEKGFGFCDVVVGWDANDQLYDNVTQTGWHTGYPDALVRILPETCREIPFEDGNLFFLGAFADEAEAVCPRGLLARVLARAREMGYRVRAGFEYEFAVFDETPQSVRDKHYHGLEPLTRGFFGYSVLRNTAEADLYRGLLALGQEMRFPFEGLHEETGAGIMEAAITASEGMEAADRAGIFKSFAKAWAQRQGLMITFMAKWSQDWPGQSGHIHLSLQDLEERPLFHAPSKADGMSDLMRHFLGGQQRFMPELLSLAAPTVNSFTRLVPGFWAPTWASWGRDNRTCALRVVPGGPSAQRIEYRIAPSDANPYLALAAAVASGLEGIAQGIEPGPETKGNAYEARVPARLAFPGTLTEAAARLRRSRTARDWFGGAFLAHFAATREWEEREFRRHVTDWEMARYFEII